MRTISKEELEKILKNHKHFLEEDTCGWETMKADFSKANLSRADLRGVDLKYANFRGASLNLANLSEAKLGYADLQGADISQADLSEANFTLTYLGGANLRETCLIRTCLRNADLCGADLRGADLRGAELRGANLRRANLIDADLRGAILMGADLREAKLPDPELMNSICPLNCPETGAFVGWKKADVILPPGDDGFIRRVDAVVKLQIPGHALRSSATSRKCRCNKAAVLDIQSLDGVSLPKGTVAYSRHDSTFTYTVGQTIWIKDFDDDRWNECSTGIHFFITRQEAVDY